MSIRSLIELNHDYYPSDEPSKYREGETQWLEQMKAFYRSGHKKDLPQGVTFKWQRHHADPDPMEGKGDPS